jgi:ribosomal protein S27AE
MKLRVSDLVVFERVVEVPDKCPQCGADLEDVGIYHWEFQDQRRSVDVVKTEDGSLGIEWDDCLPRGGEADLALTWQCGKCDATLAESEHSTAPEGSHTELREYIAEYFDWCGPEETHQKPGGERAG